MTPPHEQYTTSAPAVARAPWLGGWSGWASSALPALFDLIVVAATVLAAGQAPAGHLDPGVVMFLLALLTFQLWPDLTFRRLRPSAVDDVLPIFRRSLLAFGTVALVVTWTRIGTLDPIMQAALVATPLLIGGRAVSYASARALRSRHRGRTLVVGGGEVARRIVAALAERNEYGMEVIGALDDEPKLAADALGTRILGRIEDLPDVVRSRRIENVIVAFSSHRDSDTLTAVRSAAQEGVHVWVVPRLFELGGCARSSEHLWGYPMYKVATPAPARPEWGLKWALDLVGSAAGLVLMSPFLVLIALAIYVESGRPVLFKQLRIGRHGRPFELLKFRTMHVRDDATDSTEWNPDEDRVTRVGSFLRASGLDEAPQLLNVLRGQMSLVGPRPERPYFTERFSEQYSNYDARHRLPVGLTGWSQIHGLRGDTSIEDRAALDNYYIDNWSLAQDLKIIVKTVPTLFRKAEEEK